MATLSGTLGDAVQAATLGDTRCTFLGGTLCSGTLGNDMLSGGTIGNNMLKRSVPNGGGIAIFCLTFAACMSRDAAQAPTAADRRPLVSLVGL